MLYPTIPGVIRVEDANHTNLSGLHSDDAVASLQRLVQEEIGSRKFVVAITHAHGDHAGMLPAFEHDDDVAFWIQAEEFAGKDLPLLNALCRLVKILRWI